ncbi:MAG: hypothetical protein KDJ29_04665 [Hyphomicrobiales bacterium]|nr:hypothetical protein [Hyphomicrobiales bacterium]
MTHFPQSLCTDTRHPGRTSDEQITLHANNNGTAAADLVIAHWVYEECKSLGCGSPMLRPTPSDP